MWYIKDFTSLDVQKNLALKKTYSHNRSVLCQHSQHGRIAASILFEYLPQTTWMHCVSRLVEFGQALLEKKMKNVTRITTTTKATTTTDFIRKARDLQSEELPCWYHLNARIFRLPLIHWLICSSSELFSNYTFSKHFLYTHWFYNC